MEPFKIYSGMVNDGICDCCNGADEYNGIVKCNNTCQDKIFNELSTNMTRIENLLKVKISSY